MGRPRLIETEQILEAARQTFLEIGVGAPTSAIARRAGVSEATIFKRFRTKRDLFFTALGFPRFDARREVRELAGRGSARADLEAISLRFLEYLAEVLPVLTRLLAHPSFSAAELVRKHPQMPAQALVNAITEYIESARLAGSVGECDPGAVGSTIFAILHNAALLEHIGLMPGDKRARKRLVRSFVGVLWHGIEPAEARRRRARR